MVSTLEDILLRDRMTDGGIPSTLLGYLQDGTSLYALRLVSRKARRVVDGCPLGLFRKLYMHLPFTDAQAIDDEPAVPDSKEAGQNVDKFVKYHVPHHLTSFWAVAPTCTSLTIKVMYGKDGSPYELGDALGRVRMVNEAAEKRRMAMNPIQRRLWDFRNDHQYQEPEESMAVSVPRQETACEGQWNLDLAVWQSIFRSLTSMVQLSICVNGDPGCPGRTVIEHLLNMLRLALEHAQPAHLRTLCLFPIHSAGIVHLRWNGFAAFVERTFRPAHDCRGAPRPRHTAEIWTQLATLDLRLRNPAATPALTQNQRDMWLKVVEDYLRSFARTLRCLRFVWLDAPGPSPLALDQHPRLHHRRPIIWPRLAELWLGNAVDAERTVEMMPCRAPNVTSVKVLRDDFCSVRDLPLSSAAVWREIYPAPPPPSRARPLHPARAGSAQDVSWGGSTTSSRSFARFSAASAVPAPLSIRKQVGRRASSTFRSVFRKNEPPLRTGGAHVLHSTPSRPPRSPAPDQHIPLRTTTTVTAHERSLILGCT